MVWRTIIRAIRKKHDVNNGSHSTQRDEPHLAIRPSWTPNQGQTKRLTQGERGNARSSIRSVICLCQADDVTWPVRSSLRAGNTNCRSHAHLFIFSLLFCVVVITTPVFIVVVRGVGFCDPLPFVRAPLLCLRA